MDDRRGRGTQSSRVCVFGLLLSSSAVGCMSMPQTMSCPRGQQRHDGQCVPTSSLVFERCLESFRKTGETREQGVDTEISAQVRGQGGTLRRERKDTQKAEYDGLPEQMMSDAIVECRRQEQQQRTMEVERAWAAAEEANAQAHDAVARARAAERAQRRAEEAVARQEQANLSLVEQLEVATTALADRSEALEQQRTLLVERHPCTAQAWDGCGEQALEAKRAGDYVRAHAMYRQSCEGGSVESCGNWGVMYEHGLGTDVDLFEARRLYEEACDEGSGHACTNLGLLYEEGRGVGRDPDEAAEHYAIACDAGQMRGCGRLGRLVGSGLLEPEGHPPAVQLLTMACDGDYPRACLWVGDREILGLDEARSPEQAAHHFRHACERDVPQACLKLGQLHELGDGVSEDPGQAGQLYRQACEAGEPRGCAAAERLSRYGESELNTESIGAAPPHTGY
ncbi:MAG: sel1 repeat family protein [Deltaproteobacteria bacterium]|nr:sel1 repeat family protein [Deltaproteobacteria bacterium]